MKRLLCGSLVAMLLSLPALAQTSANPDSSVGSGTSINQDAGATDTSVEDAQRMEETSPSSEVTSPGAVDEPTTTEDIEMQEDTSLDIEDSQMMEDTESDAVTE